MPSFSSAGQFEFSSQPFTVTSATISSSGSDTITNTGYWSNYPYTNTPYITEHPIQMRDVYEWKGEVKFTPEDLQILQDAMKEPCREDMVIMDGDPTGHAS